MKAYPHSCYLVKPQVKVAAIARLIKRLTKYRKYRHDAICSLSLRAELMTERMEGEIEERSSENLAFKHHGSLISPATNGQLVSASFTSSASGKRRPIMITVIRDLVIEQGTTSAGWLPFN